MKCDYLSLHVQCNEILGKIMSSVDPDLRRQQGIDYGKDGLVQLDWSYLPTTALYRKDMNAAGESLHMRNSANAISSNQDVMCGSHMRFNPWGGKETNRHCP
jgi:hypothetical protein